MYERSLCVCQTVHLRACAYPQVLFCHNGCWKSSHQLMWKSAVEKGIVLELRQMLLLLAAFAFNLFFKPLEYPIYSPRLSELIFGATSIEETLLLFFLQAQRKTTETECSQSLGKHNLCISLCVSLFRYSEATIYACPCPACVHNWVCVYVCVRVCVHACVCVYVYVTTIQDCHTRIHTTVCVCVHVFLAAILIGALFKYWSSADIESD